VVMRRTNEPILSLAGPPGPPGATGATGATGPPGPAGDIDKVAKGGDEMTGALGLLYAASGSDVVRYMRNATQAYNFFEQRSDGRVLWKGPWGPATWGTNSPGSVGNGSDFQFRIEGSSSVAHLFELQFARHRVTDGTNYSTLTAPSTFPMTGSGTVTVANTAAYANSGTLSFTNNGHTTVGTIDYTSKDATHFLGCTSTGIPAPSDISDRHALWISDSFGAPILWVTSYSGLFCNDTLTFAAGGVFPNTNDIHIGFMNHAARSGNAIKFGNDDLVWMSRGNDGFGNNKITWNADGNQLQFYAAGLFPSTALNLGTTTNPWGIGYISSLRALGGTMANPSIRFQSEATGQYLALAGDVRTSVAGADAFGVTAAKAWVPTASKIDIGSDGLVGLSRTDDGFGNNILAIRSDAQSVRLQAAGMYPSNDAVLNLGTALNRWSRVYALGVTALRGMVRGVVALGSVTGSVNLDLSAGNHFTLTLTGNTTLTWSNVPAAGLVEVSLRVVQNGTGGWTLGLPAGTTKVGTLGTTASSTTKVELETDNGGSSNLAYLVSGFA
jgi:hypothetical protein